MRKCACKRPLGRLHINGRIILKYTSKIKSDIVRFRVPIIFNVLAEPETSTPPITKPATDRNPMLFRPRPILTTKGIILSI